MLIAHLRLALRYLAKYRVYALVNLAGLTLGLSVFVFASLLVAYETNHDHMFARRDRIFTAGSVFTSGSGPGVRELPAVRLGYGPLFESDIKDIVHIARTIHRLRLFSIGDEHFDQGLRFVEPGFTRIFDFRYIQGDPTALDNPGGLILTASTARKYWGRTDVMGETVLLEHKRRLRVTAVIEDVAADSHFNASFIPDFELTAIASWADFAALESIPLKDPLPSDMTYLLLPETRDRAWLQERVDAVFARHAPARERAEIACLKVRPLAEANVAVWDALGFPVLPSLRLLALLVLIVACVNYANLATAQSFGRAREIGLRKTFGAERPRLMFQFIAESWILAFLAAALSLTVVEVSTPMYNEWTGKVVALDYGWLTSFLFLAAVATGTLAGAYPALLISRARPVVDPRFSAAGSGGDRFRGLMITVQFSIAIFISALVLVIHFQNQKVLAMGGIFLKSPIIVLDRMDAEGVVAKRELLKRELVALADVQAISFASAVPFAEMERSRSMTVSRGDQGPAVALEVVSVDFEFLRTYGITLLAGRDFDPGNAEDRVRDGAERLNVMINQLAARTLGFSDVEEAIGQSLKVSSSSPAGPGLYTIIAVKPDQHFGGLHKKAQPIVFLIDPATHVVAALGLGDGDLEQSARNIDAVWNRVVGDRPIRRQMLDEVFQFLYRILAGIHVVMAIFAAIALFLSLTGLYGLAALMTRLRAKEIGIRKVMGAETGQIVRLLLWQFSKPVLAALFPALPFAYLAARIYLDFFPVRIWFAMPVVLLAGVAGLLTAWIVVAGHAFTIARVNPIRLLPPE